jgi:hypothetical protein
MFNPIYFKQVDLLLHTLPLLQRHDCFALKGGTALNLLVQGRTVSIADLYGGKICAALDRQHPRDLFDVLLMFEQFGLTEEIRIAFTIYLAGHPRPMSEILAPNKKPLDELFYSQFSGMTRDPVSLDTLVDVRQRLIEQINNELTENERRFLLSMKSGAPEWNRLPIENLDKFPALHWKLRNLEKMGAAKHKQAVDKLKRTLNL